MAANAHMAYAERSNGRASADPIHPELQEALDPILGESYHLLVYQEQVMAIAQQLAGYTLGEADLQAVLLARRQLVDAALGSTQARVDALRTRYRLLIDAHLIWGLQDD